MTVHEAMCNDNFSKLERKKLIRAKLYTMPVGYKAIGFLPKLYKEYCVPEGTLVLTFFPTSTTCAVANWHKRGLHYADWIVVKNQNVEFMLED